MQFLWSPLQKQNVKRPLNQEKSYYFLSCKKNNLKVFQKKNNISFNRKVYFPRYKFLEGVFFSLSDCFIFIFFTYFKGNCPIFRILCYFWGPVCEVKIYFMCNFKSCSFFHCKNDEGGRSISSMKDD